MADDEPKLKTVEEPGKVSGSPKEEEAVKDSEVPKQDDPLYHQSRKCTDWYCSLVFLFFFLALWCLSGWSFQEGYPGRLKRGWDYNGEVCGYGNLADRDYTYFAFPLGSLDVALCLPGCPQLGTYESVCLYDEQGVERTDVGCLDSYPSKPFFNKYCLPADPVYRGEVLKRLYNEDHVLTRAAGDLIRAWDLCAVIGVIVGGCWVVYFILFCVSGQVPNLVLFVLNVCALILYFIVLPFMIDEENYRVDGKICDTFIRVNMGDCDEGDTHEGYNYLAYVIGAIFFVLFFVMPCIGLRLRRGLRTLEAAGSIHKGSATLGGCIFCALFIGAGFYAYFITLIVYQVSTGEERDKPVFENFPYTTATRWEFYNGPRVLVIFDVFMVMWHFSFFAHVVEYVAASAAANWFVFGSPKGQFPLHKALFQMFRYHLGTVLLASVLVPFGRFPRIFFSGLRTVLRRVFKLPKCTLAAYDSCFRYLSSDALAYTAHVGTSFFESANTSNKLFKKHDHRQARQRLNDANSLVWLYQLAIILEGPVLMAFWVEHKDITFQGFNMRDVSSALVMIFYMLFFSWYLAQVFGSYVRGLAHGGMIAYLMHMEDPDGEKQVPEAFDKFMNELPIKEKPKGKEEQEEGLQSPGSNPTVFSSGNVPPSDAPASENSPMIQEPQVSQP